MQKGVKTSEFYVVLAVLAPWISQQFGVDLSTLVANPDDIARMIKSAHEQSSNAPVWLALVYCIGRVLLKFKDGK